MNWKTTETMPRSVERGTGEVVANAARDALRRRNGGLPPNLANASRLVLLKTIKELHAEVVRLRASQFGAR